MRSMRSKGFTLVELLVIIAIISILLSLIMVVAGSILEKSRIQQTRGTIMSLVAGCEQYKSVFGSLYPDINPVTFAVISQPGYTGSAAQLNPGNLADFTQACKEWNKRLRFLLVDRAFTIDEVAHQPFIDEKLPLERDPDDDTDNGDMFVDAWGNFIRICPGRDHTGNLPAPGPNNLHPEAAANPLSPRRPFFIPDIYSVGPDGDGLAGDTSDSGDDTTDPANVFKRTTINFDGVNAPNTNLAGDAVGDIVAWFIQKAK